MFSVEEYHSLLLKEGLHVNLAKYKFYTCNGNSRRIQNLSAILGFNVGNMPFNYLGVPSLKGSLEGCIFNL
ncbi:hypothetical protein Lalb_Chr21g0318811 [Lupinus albus]|uniref:RNA-directed DNA polymerase n=1 Tax=Lupinus albus TaxID=3870 RepID=A0A6A4NRV3_LUPAL|nr:hypothetical protein Lalb_Chr21g0318811 [Lupinus albus]